MRTDWIAMSTDLRHTMPDSHYSVKRASPRFSFFADAEVTLRDGSSLRAQLAELSSGGCYIGALEPIPIRTRLRLLIHDGLSTCELHGKVIYMHSGGGGLGIFGMGVAFEEMGSEQHSTIDAWMRSLAARPAQDLKNSLPQIRG
jgi:PilZ domain